MSRIAGAIVVASMLAATSAHAQEASPSPAGVDITLIPGGATFFTGKPPASSFGSYALGGALGFNFSHVVGVEADLGASLQMGARETSPYMVSYAGNVIIHAPGHRLVPYVTGGVGGLTVYDNPALQIARSDTYLTGNGGGGVKWFALNGRWGVRGDYRFEAVRSNSNASAFFGWDTRYAHRVYGGLLINVTR